LKNIIQKSYDAFSKKGYILIPNFYNYESQIQPIQKKIARIINLIAHKKNIEIPYSKSIEIIKYGFMHLINLDRSAGGEVYDAIKQIPEFLDLVSDQKNQNIFEKLRKNSLPGIADGGYGIRIDIPGEKKFEAPWHQEYPAQMRSLDGIVFWSPLVEIEQKLGPVEIAECSHNDGLLKVCSKTENGLKQGAYSLRITNEDGILEKYSKVNPLTKPGDLILMDYLLLHRSGKNYLDFPRWSMQWRMFNFLDSTGINIGWRNNYNHKGLNLNQK